MQHVYLCLVQGGLFRREGAIGRYFRFVRQVGNQRRIRFHSAQDEGAYQASQRGITAFQGTGEGFEAFSAAQQPRIQKFHQAPEFIQVIFHRRAGQGYASFPMQGTDGAGTGGACVFNSLGRCCVLGFIQNNGREMQVGQGGRACSHAIRSNDGVAVFPAQGIFRLPRVRGGRVHDAQDKLRSEALRFLFPVGQEGGRSHNQSRQALQPAFSPQCVQPRNSLKGFSQPHIIRQAGAETPFRNPVKEREPFFLVRAHQGVQPGRKLRYGDWDFPR